MNQPTPAGAYVPGVCNINPKEIAYRRKAGWGGVVIAVGLAAVLIALKLPHWLLIVIFLPAFVAALGFLQAKHHFCVSYAGQGMQNAAGNSMDTAKKVSAADRAKDRLRASRIYLQSGAIAAAAAIIAILISLISFK